MEPIKESPDKKSGEVVVMISERGQESKLNPKTESFEDSSKEAPKDSVPKSIPPSPEIKISASPRKPPRPPQPESLVRRRSIPSSTFSKPKSRFVEQAQPNAPNLPEDNRAVIPGTPKTPFSFDEEEEEEEVYKKEQIHEKARKKQRRCKIRVSIEWTILVLAMGCLIASILVPQLENFTIWSLEIWKWCLMVTVICCGHLLTRWFITFVVFMIEKNFLFKKKVLYFVYGLKSSVRVCIWLGLVLLTWSLLFNNGDKKRPQKTEKILNYVSRALISLLVGSVIWLSKTLLVKIMAASFHMNAFFDRIQESFFHQYVLQVLSGPPVMELAEKVGKSASKGQLSFRNVEKGKEKGGEEIDHIDVGKLHKMQQEKISAWKMKGLINVIRSSGLTTISNTIAESFDDGEQKDTEITSEWEAKAAAYRIFKNVAKPGHKYIDEEDLMRFLNKEEIEYALPSFEGASETRKIKKSALKNWVVKAYLERKSLAHSLDDTKTAVKQLHQLATVVVVIIIIIVTLLLMGLATTQVLVLLSSQVLLVGFMFQNTCKTVFEAIIFVFVMHPFDVGDRCLVDGVQLIVEEMNIFTTVFLKFDNEKIYYPNATLAAKPISNFYRSPDMRDSVEFGVDVSTSIESIGALKSRIKKYIESKPTHWHPEHSMVAKEIVNMNKMNMALFVQHTINFQNVGEKNNRKSELILELKRIFEDLSIRYHLLPQEVQLTRVDSTVTNMFTSQRS